MIDFNFNATSFRWKIQWELINLIHLNFLFLFLFQFFCIQHFSPKKNLKNIVACQCVSSFDTFPSCQTASPNKWLTFWDDLRQSDVCIGWEVLWQIRTRLEAPAIHTNCIPIWLGRHYVSWYSNQAMPIEWYRLLWGHLWISAPNTLVLHGICPTLLTIPRNTNGQEFWKKFKISYFYFYFLICKLMRKNRESYAYGSGRLGIFNNSCAYFSAKRYSPKLICT